MSEGSRELERRIPKPEAPFPSNANENLPRGERFARWVQERDVDGEKKPDSELTRRAVVAGGLAAIGAGIFGIIKHGDNESSQNVQASSSTNQEQLGSKEILETPQIRFYRRDEDDQLILSDVAEYLEIQNLIKVENGRDLEHPFLPKIREFTSYEDLEEGKNEANSRLIETKGLAGNVCAVRVGVPIDNGFRGEQEARMKTHNPEDPNKWEYMFLALVDKDQRKRNPSNPTFVNENGQALEGEIALMSPIFADAEEFKD